MRVDSELGKGSQFSFLLPFGISYRISDSLSTTASSRSSMLHVPTSGQTVRGNEIDHLVEALSSSHMKDTAGLLAPIPMSLAPSGGSPQQHNECIGGSRNMTQSLEKSKSVQRSDALLADNIPRKLRILIVEVWYAFNSCVMSSDGVHCKGQ